MKNSLFTLFLFATSLCAEFQVIEGSFTWHEAKADAEARGGRLAVLDTQDKIDAANTYLQGLGTWPFLWIGLSTQTSDASWIWIDGSNLTASNWDPAEPSMEYGNQGYAFIYANPFSKGPGLWDDTGGNEPYSYLLETPDSIDKIYWIDDSSGSLELLDLGWGSIDKLFNGFGSAIGLPQDEDSIYLIERTNGKLYQLSEDAVVPLIEGMGDISDFHVDQTGTIYWADTISGGISYYNGFIIKNLLENCGHVTGLTKHGDALIFSEKNTGKIYSYNLNTEQVSTLIDGIGSPSTITSINDKLYFADNDSGSIYQYDLSAQTVTEIISGNSDNVSKLFATYKDLYWVDNSSSKLYSYNFEQKSIQGLVQNIGHSNAIVAQVDTDGDGIYDLYESNTGIYLNSKNTGSDPQVADTNTDGISDLESISLNLNPSVDYSPFIQVVQNDPATYDLVTQDDLNQERQEGQTDVTGNPSQYGLFTSSDLSDAQTSSRSEGQQDVISSPSDYNLMGAEGVFDMRVSQPGISTNADKASMNFTIQSSNDLEEWNNEETIRRAYTMLSDKNFMRVSVGPQLETEPLPSVATDTYGDKLVYDESNNLYVNDENTPLKRNGENLRTDTYTGYNFYAIESTSSGYICILKSNTLNYVFTFDSYGNYTSLSAVVDLSAYESDFGQSLN